VLSTAVDLFAEFADAFARGERPRVADYLARVQNTADEGLLAGMIERFLQSTPRQTARPEDAERLALWLSEPPILVERRQRGLTRDAVVDRLLVLLGLSDGNKRRLATAYHELETGQLDPERVDERVWSAMREIFKVSVRELASWRPPAVPAAPAYRGSSTDIALATHARLRKNQEPAVDEVDRLFRGVSKPGSNQGI
jgi:hypothetical protein